MSSLWVYVESLSESAVVRLESDEARHVVSRRLRVGDELTVFDAAGTTAPARILGLGRRVVEVEVGSTHSTPPPETGIGLATAIPKGDRLSTMLQMWTQLGLEVWQPLVCDDSSVRKLDARSPRIQRILVEGCKVARRPWSMRILPPLDLATAIETCGPEASLYFADREGKGDPPKGGRGWVFVGPEAGFSESELARLRAEGATALSLGHYNLRIETAGVAAMSVLNLCREGTPDVAG